MAMVLLPSQAGAANVVARKAQLWPSRTVAFVLCDAVTAKRLGRKVCAPQAVRGKGRADSAVLDETEVATVRQAVSAWNRDFEGNIRFVEVEEPKEQNLVVFRASARPSRCSTQRVGYAPDQRRKYISVGPSCGKGDGAETGAGTVAHEMMHAVGFYHEQQRSDRGRMIRINGDAGSKAHQWKPVCEQGCKRSARKAQAIGPYDFNSIMHYSLDGGGPDATPTSAGRRRMASQDVLRSNVGQRRWMSKDDVAAIKRLYPAKRERL